MNKPFVLSFVDNEDRTGHMQYFHLKVEIKDNSLKVDVLILFDQPIKNDIQNS